VFLELRGFLGSVQSLVVVYYELTRISLHSGRQTVQAVLFTQTSQFGRHKLYSTSLIASVGSMKLITSSTDETLEDYIRTRIFRRKLFPTYLCLP
jgi:hypothetical protein